MKLRLIFYYNLFYSMVKGFNANRKHTIVTSSKLLLVLPKARQNYIIIMI